MLTIALLAIVALAVAVFVVFVALCLAIRRESRSPRLTSLAPTAGTAATRRVTGLWVRRATPPSPASQPGPSVVLEDASCPPESGPEGR